MINQKENYKNHIISGFFILASLLILVTFIMLLGKENSIFENQTKIQTVVNNAQNLKINSAVYLKGIKIGHIDNIYIAPAGNINITMKITMSHMQWIKSDSVINVRTHGVLGDTFLEINGGTTSSPSIPENGLIKTEESGQFDRIITKGEDVLVSATRAILLLESLLDKIPSSKITSIIEKLDTLLGTLNKSAKKINSLDTIAMNKFINNTTEITERVKTGPGTMNELIYDRTLYDDLRKVFGNNKRNSVLNYFIRESIEKSEKIEK